MNYDPYLHHRRSIRLKGYDYSQNGAYFITICTQDRENCFGEIINVQIVHNDAAHMVGKWYNELTNKYPNIELDEFVIMPNHFHCIIQIINENTGQNMGHNVGQTHRSAPTMDDNNESVGANLCVRPKINEIIQWFKTMTSNEYIRNVKQQGWKSFSGKLWQRNYYEHIIRDENELNRIRNYIKTNLIKWQSDQNNPESLCIDARPCVSTNKKYNLL